MKILSLTEQVQSESIGEKSYRYWGAFKFITPEGTKAVPKRAVLVG